jgi:hypothetical protein
VDQIGFQEAQIKTIIRCYSQTVVKYSVEVTDGKKTYGEVTVVVNPVPSILR